MKQLKGYRQHRLAYMYLSFLANGYVWQEGNEGVSKVSVVVFPKCTILIRSQWRVQDFPDWAPAPKVGGANLLF